MVFSYLLDIPVDSNRRKLHVNTEIDISYVATLSETLIYHNLFWYKSLLGLSSLNVFIEDSCTENRREKISWKDSIALYFNNDIYCSKEGFTKSRTKQFVVYSISYGYRLFCQSLYIVKTFIGHVIFLINTYLNQSVK